MLFTRRNSPREDYDAMMDAARTDAQKRKDAWTPEAREAAAYARGGGSVGRKSPGHYAAMREEDRKAGEENRRAMEESAKSPRYLAARKALGLKS